MLIFAILEGEEVCCMGVECCMGGWVPWDACSHVVELYIITRPLGGFRSVHSLRQ